MTVLVLRSRCPGGGGRGGEEEEEEGEEEEEEEEAVVPSCFASTLLCSSCTLTAEARGGPRMATVGEEGEGGVWMGGGDDGGRGEGRRERR
ncbi:hypothetical protein E2C01_099356 [Portunus trituberculatus]|uniref:Uncharacterized protein n=1 Tax=Portunus trituberculatus TaxID=210409 RepID=A0A5B7KAS3_PORTR|nr:hypothetical protein [Portunus trituberculatus]